MGGVFAAAAQAPLTAIASVAEMTGNFTLILPIMLACGIAAQLAKRITYGSIYTTKLLRRGIDIERPKALGALQALTVEQVMQPLDHSERQPSMTAAGRPPAACDEPDWERLVGPVTLRRSPQALFAEEDLEDARRQLVLYGRDGLPVLTRDGKLHGWLTRADVLRALAHQAKVLRSGDRGRRRRGRIRRHRPSRPRSTCPARQCAGYEMLELRITPDSPARGRRIAEIKWPPGCDRRGRNPPAARSTPLGQTSRSNPTNGR